MPVEIRETNIEDLFTGSDDFQTSLKWPSIFTLPSWIKSWWKVFGSDYQLFVRTIYKENYLLGIAPLMLKNGEAFLIGSPDVCDYLDFITPVDSKAEQEFFRILLPHLKEQGVKKLVLKSQRSDAAFFRAGFAAQELPAFKMSFSREAETFELNLASNWEDYLAGLTKKQRHEVRRKLRRLRDETESFNYRVLESPADIKSFIPDFLNLFKQNPEKAEFLTSKHENYFYKLITETAEHDLVRFGLLKIDGQTVAAVLYFDYRQRTYLYNSGYNPAYRELSAGLLSKVLCIKDNIGKDRKIFDFLKGREVYKSRLGGKSIPIYTITISIS